MLTRVVLKFAVIVLSFVSLAGCAASRNASLENFAPDSGVAHVRHGTGLSSQVGDY
jgi:hypothetical protein